MGHTEHISEVCDHCDGLMTSNRHNRSANMAKWERHMSNGDDLVLFTHLYMPRTELLRSGFTDSSNLNKVIVPYI